MKNNICTIAFIFSLLMNVNSQEIVFNSTRGKLQFDEIIFLNNNKTTRTIHLRKENPYNSLTLNFNDSSAFDSKTYVVSFGDARDFINGLSSDNKIKDQRFPDTTKFLLRSNYFVSWIPFQSIKSYKTVAISYCIYLSTLDYETTIASQSIVKAYNNHGEEIYSELIDKYITSVGITPGAELLAYSWDCDWPNCDLFVPGYKIIDLNSRKSLLEVNSKSGFPFTWQIENGIGWRDLYIGREVTFYLLINGETVIIENNLVHGVIKIENDRIILIKNDGERYSRPRNGRNINILN